MNTMTIAFMVMCVCVAFTSSLPTAEQLVPVRETGVVTEGLEAQESRYGGNAGAPITGYGYGGYGGGYGGHGSGHYGGGWGRG